MRFPECNGVDDGGVAWTTVRWKGTRHSCPRSLQADGHGIRGAQADWSDVSAVVSTSPSVGWRRSSGSRPPAWPGGRRAGLSPSVAELEAVLALADLTLVAVDGEGEIVDPMSEEAIRDRAGRRYPAHADLGRSAGGYPRDSWLTPRERDEERRSAAAGDPRIFYGLGWLRDARAALLRRAARPPDPRRGAPVPAGGGRAATPRVLNRPGAPDTSPPDLPETGARPAPEPD